MEPETLRIGEVAQRSGVSIQTLRFYERLGLLKAPSRRRSGYRQFSPRAVQIVRFIKWAQGLEFSLKEIKEMVGLLSDPPRRPVPGLRSRVHDKMQEIDQRIERLSLVRNALHELAECYCGGNCPIITSAIAERSNNKS
jgi:MerR family transcriptional regulator, copper efflux regulator